MIQIWVHTVPLSVTQDIGNCIKILHAKLSVSTM